MQTIFTMPQASSNKLNHNADKTMNVYTTNTTFNKSYLVTKSYKTTKLENVSNMCKMRFILWFYCGNIDLFY